MNKGIIATDYKHNVIVLHEFIDDNGRVIYEELPLHPFYKNYNSFILGQEINFQYAKECTIHYPNYCDCFKLRTFALIVPDKKTNLFKRFKNLFKK